MNEYDIVIIGAGIYGLHAAFNLKFKNKKILIVEMENNILNGASLNNQARLHNGYHYPRSFETAENAKRFFSKCYEEYKFAINDSFKSIYAISKENSLTTSKQFECFCDNLKIKYEKIDKSIYFKSNMVEKAYITEEYTFDVDLIRKYYIQKLNEADNIDIKYNTYIKKVKEQEKKYILVLNDDSIINADVVISTVYKNINYINKMFKQKLIDIKYELCELELVNVNDNLKNLGITIMDGPFFSIMPFGKKNIDTLTSVCFTPHETSFNKLPNFSCQKNFQMCKDDFLQSCNSCKFKPSPKKKEFLELFNEYMKDEYKYEYIESLFAIKPILISSENDDSRPTIIKKYSTDPTYISCLSGKFSTVYLLDDFIEKNF